MNARQKAKYYKRKYDELVKRPITCSVERHNIETLQFVQHFPARIIDRVTDRYPREIVKGRIAQYLADNLDKYIVYRTIYNAYMEEYQVYGRLQVVVNLYNMEV